MKWYGVYAVAAFLSLPTQTSASYRVVTCAADITRAVLRAESNLSFRVTATVTCVPRLYTVGIKDDSGYAVLLDYTDGIFKDVRPGDRIIASGRICNDNADLVSTVDCQHLKIIAHGDPPAPIPITAHDLRNAESAYKYVSVHGMVRDAFIDEIDSEWLYLILNTAGGTCAITVFQPKNNMSLESLVGADIEVRGIVTLNNIQMRPGSRILLKKTLSSSLDGIRIIQPVPDDPFNVPQLDVEVAAEPEDLLQLGLRRISGRAIAKWGGHNMMLKTADGKIFRCVLKEKTAEPPCGEFIDVVGLPETDLFHINLTRAFWRKSPNAATFTEATPERITAKQLFLDENGAAKIQTRFHGSPVTMEGIVHSLPSPKEPRGRLYMESGHFTVPIDVSETSGALDGISIGCTIAVTGICVTEIDNWAPHSPFPHIREVFIVPRTSTDIVILRHPPWWTPQRLLVILASLLFVLLVILIWNLLLRRLAERRGKELAEEHIARAETDLKVMERTRLAVELHDSVAQNLTGVAMELETARQFQKGAHPELLSHLNIAWRTLKSCRDELRNCLWDLRSQALEEPNMETAVRRTLTPHVKGVTLVIRFNVPRAIISDNTAHALLRIIRELVLNSIRHGKAKTIHIAGCIEADALKFSVKDDGCGFDPKTCPGVDDGHYGLQGIRERICQLGGKMAIESGKEKGTKVSITIHMRRPLEI